MPDTHHAALPAPSWLNLPPAPSTSELDALFDRTRDKLGYVRHSQRATAHRPVLTLAQDALSRAVNRDAPGGLSRRERELIAHLNASDIQRGLWPGENMPTQPRLPFSSARDLIRISS